MLNKESLKPNQFETGKLIRVMIDTNFLQNDSKIDQEQ